MTSPSGSPTSTAVKIGLSLTMAAGQIVSPPASADWLRDRVSDLGRVVSQIPHVINPIAAPIDIVTRAINSPETLVSGFIRDQGRNLGTFTQAARQVTAVDTVLIRELSKVTSNEVRIALDFESSKSHYQGGCVHKP